LTACSAADTKTATGRRIPEADEPGAALRLLA
jgi:hypothetical protein